MRLTGIVLAAVLMAGPVFGQDPSSTGTAQSPSVSRPAADTGELPVSLDRIREGLQRPDGPVAGALDRRADFSVEVEEKQKLDELLKRLEVSGGPVPAGGLYMYEQQRRLFNPTERPLQQPYAAFNGGELITIAIQNLIGQYLGRPLLDSIKAANRLRQERDARTEVQQAITAYCATRPDRWDMELCNPTVR